jgi:hypothetical protein
LTTSNLQRRSISVCFALAGGVLAALVLTACGKAPDQASVPPAAEAGGPAQASTSLGNQVAASAPTPPASLIVTAPTDIKAPPAGTIAPPNPNAAAEATADNAKAAELAKQFEADPGAIARQNVACGPANQVVNNLYAVSHGVQTDGLRRFRLACMAKDDAQRELAKRAATAAGGVKNTNSL